VNRRGAKRAPAVVLFRGNVVNEIIFMVSEPPEGGYAAEALGQSTYTVAETLDELARREVISG